MSHLTRSTDALTAALADLTNADRATRNINRLRGHSGQVPRDPVDLDNLISVKWRRIARLTPALATAGSLSPGRL